MTGGRARGNGDGGGVTGKGVLRGSVPSQWVLEFRWAGGGDKEWGGAGGNGDGGWGRGDRGAGGMVRGRGVTRGVGTGR